METTKLSSIIASIDHFWSCLVYSQCQTQGQDQGLEWFMTVTSTNISLKQAHILHWVSVGMNIQIQEFSW